MIKRLFLLSSMFLLVACGQAVDQHAIGDVEEKEKEVTLESKEKIDLSNENTEVDESAEPKVEENEENNEQNTNEALPKLNIHYIDANQADATLFQYTDDDKTYTILYDAGDWNRNDVINYLAAQDISFIDLVIISHPHADHNGQLAEVMNTYDVGEVWLSGNTATSNTFQTAIEAVLDSDADYYEPRAGDTFDVGSMGIEVLHPSTLTGKLNEDSISLLFTYGDLKFLFTGDAYKNEELLMMDRADVQADILQLGHHGSNTSSDPKFIKAVNPDVAIYSASENNSYNHPHPDVVSFIQQAEITLYGTDVHGTVVVKTDGKEYTVLTNKDGTISPASTGSSNKKKDNKQKKKQSTTNKEDCVDINNASADELQAIIHMGPARAGDVIDQRSYGSVDDLTKVNGIGPARIDDIKSEGIACVK